ncbi:MAG: class II fructose-bisphosphate aldolase [Anaerolineae bacterium]|nr:class II fructose-bisphosphate aldolase [Anaerolineae bacterium]
MPDTATIMAAARRAGVVIPSFNIPYLPMLAPVVRAVVDQEAFALIAVARLEWIKFQAKSLTAVAEEFARWAQPNYVRLHLDHVPVIDEDNEPVDYLPIIREALKLGYQSVMVDGSRLPLAENIAATRAVADLAHAAGVPVEAELGAVLGHEAGPLPPYEELYASGKGFTDVEEARRFVAETGCDWLSVAIGNIHGAIAAGARDQKKVEARLNLERLDELAAATGIPLVLHGGSGIRREYLLEAFRRGIAKINIGTEIRQTYEQAWRATGDVAAAQEAVYQRTTWVLRDYLGVAGRRQAVVNPD